MLGTCRQLGSKLVSENALHVGHVHYAECLGSQGKPVPSALLRQAPEGFVGGSLQLSSYLLQLRGAPSHIPMAKGARLCTACYQHDQHAGYLQGHLDFPPCSTVLALRF